MKKFFKWFGIVVLLIALIVGILFFKYLYPFMKKMKETEVVQFDKDLTLITGGGGNSGILNSDSLVVVIDTKMDAAAEELHAQVMKIAGSKPILVINTHIHPDHVKGNELYKGASILAGANYGKELWIKEAGEKNLPTEWIKDRMDLRIGDDTLTILNLNKNVHTQSDVFVYLHKRKVLFGGDVVLNKQAPVIMGVGSAPAYQETLDWLPTAFDIQTIVPGHGRIGGIEIIDNFKAYFNDMKTAATEPSKKSELVAKYEDWNQIPVVMSPGATIASFEKAAGK
jgi:cyclase